MTQSDPVLLTRPAHSAGRIGSLALTSVCLALFATATSMSCVFAILPSFSWDLGLSKPQIGWVVTPAALVFVLFGPVWGRLGQHWSARAIFTAALLMMAVFSLLFGFTLAWRLETRISALLCFVLLIVSRVLLSPFDTACGYHTHGNCGGIGRDTGYISKNSCFCFQCIPILDGGWFHGGCVLPIRPHIQGMKELAIREPCSSALSPCWWHA